MTRATGPPQRGLRHALETFETVSALTAAILIRGHGLLLPAGFQLSNALLDRLQALPYVCRLLFEH